MQISILNTPLIQVDSAVCKPKRASSEVLSLTDIVAFQYIHLWGSQLFPFLEHGSM